MAPPGPVQLLLKVGFLAFGVGGVGAVGAGALDRVQGAAPAIAVSDVVEHGLLGRRLRVQVPGQQVEGLEELGVGHALDGADLGPGGQRGLGQALGRQGQVGDDVHGGQALPQLGDQLQGLAQPQVDHDDVGAGRLDEPEASGPVDGDVDDLHLFEGGQPLRQAGSPARSVGDDDPDGPASVVRAQRGDGSSGLGVGGRDLNGARHISRAHRHRG